MITDDMLIYLLFQIVLMVINLISYSKIPFLGVIGIIATFSTAYQTIMAFDTYWVFGLVLILCNIMIPILGFTKARQGD